MDNVPIRPPLDPYFDFTFTGAELVVDCDAHEFCIFARRSMSSALFSVIGMVSEGTTSETRIGRGLGRFHRIRVICLRCWSVSLDVQHLIYLVRNIRWRYFGSIFE